MLLPLLASAAIASPVLVSDLHTLTGEVPAAELRPLQAEIVERLGASTLEDLGATRDFEPCPREDVALACTMIIAERAGLEWALAGAVREELLTLELARVDLRRPELVVTMSFTAPFSSSEIAEVVAGELATQLFTLEEEVILVEDPRLKEVAALQDPGFGAIYDELAQRRRDLELARSLMASPFEGRDGRGLAEVSLSFGRGLGLSEQGGYQFSGAELTSTWSSTAIEPGASLSLGIAAGRYLGERGSVLASVALQTTQHSIVITSESEEVVQLERDGSDLSWELGAGYRRCAGEGLLHPVLGGGLGVTLLTPMLDEEGLPALGIVPRSWAELSLGASYATDHLDLFVSAPVRLYPNLQGQDPIINLSISLTTQLHR